MLHLNIIPENQKKQIKLKTIYDNTFKLFEVIFIIIILYIIIFLIIKLILANHFITTIENTTILTKRTEDYSRQISDINKKITTINNIQNEFINWSKLIEILNKKSTAGLTLNQISIDKNTKILTLNGLAKTRNDLLTFKDEIDVLMLFEEINIPIRNLLKKEDISFNISVKIKFYDF